MIDCQKIKALAEQQLVGTDVFVVSCKVSPSNEVELLLDSDTSVQLETCAAVNRAVNEAMADDEEDFSLTVASGRSAAVERHEDPCAARCGGCRGDHALLRGEAGGRGQKAQAAGEGGQTLRLLRGEIYEGVPGFQVDGSK